MKKDSIFVKINIVDIIIITFAILFVFSSVYKALFMKKPDLSAIEPEVKAGGEIIATDIKATAKYRIKNIRSFLIDEIKDGDICYYTYGEKAGEITNVTNEKYYEYGVNDANEYAKYEYSERYNIFFEIELDGHHTRSAFNGIDWIPVGIGTMHYYEIGGVCFECEVMDVKINYDNDNYKKELKTNEKV